MRRTRARQFGDNPHIRHSHGEASQINPNEPWERHYAGIRKRTARVRPHYALRHGRRVRVKGHIRKLV